MAFGQLRRAAPTVSGTRLVEAEEEGGAGAV